MSKAQTKQPVSGGGFLLSETDEERVFTPEDFTDEHEMIFKTAHQFVEKEVEPHQEAIESQDFNLVVSMLRKAGDAGLLGHSIPEAYGGLGLDKISKGIVGEAIGKSGGYGVAHANHTCIATLPITYFGTADQKQKYLPKLASGEYIGAYCLTEPSAGSDALSAKTKAELTSDKTHYVLNGTKIYITNAQFSDTFIVYAKVDGEKFTAFIVEKDFPGLSLGPEEKKMGIKGSSTRSVIMEDCLVPVENVLGEIGRGHIIALNVLNLGRFNLGSACVGAAKYGLELALAYTNERKQFKRTIAAFGATKEKIAQMTARIYAAESLQYRTAGLLEEALGDVDDGDDHKQIGKQMMAYVMECAVCKVYSSETLDLVVDESLQLHGGNGFINEYRIEQMYRDSRINRIFEGSNEINRLLIPGLLYKKAAKGEIALETIIADAKKALHEPPSKTGDILSEERQAVASIRRVFLLLAGLAYETLGEELEEAQETLMKLSDIAIQLYATESAVLRSVKAITKNGENKETMKQLLAVSLVSDTMIDVEGIARKLASGMLSGEQLSEVNRLITGTFGTYCAEDVVSCNRAIADRINEKQRYTC